MTEQLFSPAYFKCFSCIADKCFDSCCRSGWEIPLDDDTYSFYKSCNVDDLDLKTCIGSDGDRIFRLKENGDCPYLLENGLCDLYIRTGGRLGEICKNYPRFKEEYDGFSEIGVSISCPEAQRLILMAGRDDYLFDGEKPCEEFLGFLHAARNVIMDIIYSEPSPDIAAIRLLDYSSLLQDAVDLGEIDSLPDEMRFPVENADDMIRSCAANGSLAIIESTDTLYSEWRELLINSRFDSDLTTDDRKRAYLTYLVFRFFLRAVSTEDVYSVCALILILYSVVTRSGDRFEETARLAAKEIEHSRDNFDALLDRLAEGGGVL